MTTREDREQRRLRYWLAITLRAAREGAGMPPDAVATVLGVHSKTISRIEDPTEGYGRDIDRAVAAYAYVLGIKDPRRLWQRALDAWTETTPPPDFSKELTGARFVRPIREAVRKQKEVRDGTPETPDAKVNRRAGR